MNGKYNIWNKWDPLKTVMLGDTYPAEFFRDIKNNKIRSALTQIADESQEDLENYSNVLKEFGCEVIRPKIDLTDNIMNHTGSNGVLTRVPSAPLQVRDTQLVIGEKLFVTNREHDSIVTELMKYNRTDLLFMRHEPLCEYSYTGLRCIESKQWPSYNTYVRHFDDENYFFPHVWKEIHDLLIIDIEHNDGFYMMPGIDAPGITVVGEDLYFDNKPNPRLIPKGTSLAQMQKGFKVFKNLKHIKNNFRVNNLSIGGHNDGVFGLLKPGAAMSILTDGQAHGMFDDWDVCCLPEESFHAMEGFLKIKRSNKGTFWVPGQEDNDAFTHFVQTWLSDWVGYVEESVFDVNVLVLDEHHVCVNNLNNPTVNAFLKKHKMEPVHVPWRHRYFWDGGLHCITLDLYREGKQQNYFPNRTESFTQKSQYAHYNLIV